MKTKSSGLASTFLIPFHVERGQGGLSHLFHGNLVAPNLPTLRNSPSLESSLTTYGLSRRRALQLTAIGGASLLLPARQSEAQLGAILGFAVPWFLAGAKWLALTVMGAAVSYTVQQMLDERLYGEFKRTTVDEQLRTHRQFAEEVKIERQVIPAKPVRLYRGYETKIGYEPDDGFLPYSHNTGEIRSYYLLEHHVKHPGVPAEMTPEAFEKFSTNGQFYGLHARSREKPKFTPELERQLAFANYRTFKDKSEKVKPEDVEYVGNFRNYDGVDYTGFSVKRNGQRMILAAIEE